MPLPSGDVSWPPVPHRGVQRDLTEWAAWYSGDTEDLGKVYGQQAEQSASSRADGYTTLANRMRFWGRRGADTPSNRQRLHVPVASDIATTSADLLFGDEPILRIREATEENAESDAKAAQDRLTDIADEIGLFNLLLEASEVCAALGGIYLRPGWDLVNSPDCPTLDVVHADAAVPEWRGNQLIAVTFWKVILRDGQKVMRLLERHENGVILNGLYLGTPDKLGSAVPLKNSVETENLEESITIPTELNERMLVRYVPNVRPNRKHRHLPIGRADFAGVEPLMDALDETYTSWMRDIRLGQARLMVSEDALERGPRGSGASFNYDQEVFTPLGIDPSAKDGGALITPIQFAIRMEEHSGTAADLFEHIVTSSGYSPQTFGLHIEGQAESGTALRVREGKTLKTRARKGRYMIPGVEDTLQILLAIDRHLLKRTDHGVYRPSVDLADVIVNNPIEVAQSISMLRTARVMSVETGVRLAQPSLDDAGVVAETKRILDEDTLVSDPTGGFA